MKRFWCVLFGGICLTAEAQDLTARWQKVADLPFEISESSGLVRSTKGTFWTHGDGGNPAEIYEIDSAGTWLRTLTFSNAVNIDWEDISMDSRGDFWLGDVGNNDSDREDLKLYHIENPDNHDSTSVHVRVLNLVYEDQRNIPSPIGNRNFDVEAIVCYKDSILLITKNRSFPNSGYAKIYKVPAVTGSVKATLVDSIYTETNIQLGRITGADYHLKTGNLVLCALQMIYVMPFNGNRIDPKTIKRYRMPYHTNQFESVVWHTESELFLTAEKPSILARVTLIDSAFNFPLSVENPQRNMFIHEQDLIIAGPGTFSGMLFCYDLKGSVVWQASVLNANRVRLPKLPNATYVLRVMGINGFQQSLRFFSGN